MPNVMLHGDTWINNIMFLKDPKNPKQLTDEVAAFFDWQISTCGCGLNDLARLTAWCVPHDLRRLQSDVILKIYFDEFTSKVDPTVLGTDFTLERASMVFNRTLAVHGLLGVPMVDFMLNFLGKVHEDETGWRKETLLNRVKASYDDCVTYFNSSANIAFLEL
uniref:CHK kinase-like domain-containing protein n=1 Tax=Romanomermis culicivorax TaxID=13658 RepID=A0A915I083_ROMCU